MEIEIRRQSKFFGKARKEAPREAKSASHRYLVRGGYVEKLMSGVYSLLPLGWRVHERVEEIVRQEMNRIGGQEISMPSMIPAELWKETERWEKIDPPLYKFVDRHEREIGLGSTHEEVVTDLARRQDLTYKDLPLAVYQIQRKFRNEMRATSGLLRVREFTMKDLYSFHADYEDLTDYYEKVKAAYLKIFDRCGLKVYPVEAETGTIGGSLSHEFALIAEEGEDRVLFCPGCQYAANVEKAGEITACPECGEKLEVKACIENGHTFNLGTKYSRAMGATFVDQDGSEKELIMGCYGIGIGRLVASMVEVHHDDQGIIWPQTVAPFTVHLLALQMKNQEVVAAAERIADDLGQNGIEVLFDDREVSPGQKFSEADLIGLPWRVVISEKTLQEDIIEIKARQDKEPRKVDLSKLLAMILD